MEKGGFNPSRHMHHMKQCNPAPTYMSPPIAWSLWPLRSVAHQHTVYMLQEQDVGTMCPQLRWRSGWSLPYSGDFIGIGCLCCLSVSSWYCPLSIHWFCTSVAGTKQRIHTFCMQAILITLAFYWKFWNAGQGRKKVCWYQLWITGVPASPPDQVPI